MSVQFGILARLTWWEYSWDIMEPGNHLLVLSNEKLFILTCLFIGISYKFKQVKALFSITRTKSLSTKFLKAVFSMTNFQ